MARQEWKPKTPPGSEKKILRHLRRARLFVLPFNRLSYSDSHRWPQHSLWDAMEQLVVVSTKCKFAWDIREERWALFIYKKSNGEDDR